jgi:hypothetical protein
LLLENVRKALMNRGKFNGSSFGREIYRTVFAEARTEQTGVE